MRALALASLTIIVTSCGPSLTFTEDVPGEVNLGHGSAVSVSARHYDPAASMIADALRRRIASGGFYSLSYNSPNLLVVDNIRIRDYEWDQYIDDCDKHRDREWRDKHRPSDYRTRYLNATVSFTANGMYSTFSRDYESSFSSWSDRYSAADSIARQVYNDLAPHQRSFNVSLDIDEDKTPILYQAATLCEQEQWSAGSSMAARAVSAYPNCAEAYYLQGLIARHYRNYADSDRLFDKAYSLKPESRYLTSKSANASIISNKQAYDAQYSR